MGYDLGVDLGGTSVAAARTTGSHVEMVGLGDRSPVVPATVFLGDDGALITGEAAARRAVGHPGRAARDLRRRLGAGTTLQLGGRTHEVSALLAALLRDVLGRAVETVGAPPDRVALSHPAHWDGARREAVVDMARTVGLPEARLVTEPEAAAAQYAATGRFADGTTIAVYDLGGSTFDATVLRNTGGRIEIVGQPDGVERLGGAAFDEAILSHVNQVAGGALSGLRARDPQHAAAVARLRQECLQAKEALTVDTETTIGVFLPNRHLEVALTRAEFEGLIRTPVETTIMTLIRVLQAAQVDPAELAAVLLVGGSARIPLVARMISDALARPVVLDAHPEHAVALGAAALAASIVPTRLEPARVDQPAWAAAEPLAAVPEQAAAPLDALVAAGPATARMSAVPAGAVFPPRRRPVDESHPGSLFEPVTDPAAARIPAPAGPPPQPEYAVAPAAAPERDAGDPAPGDGTSSDPAPDQDAAPDRVAAAGDAPADRAVPDWAVGGGAAGRVTARNGSMGHGSTDTTIAGGSAANGSAVNGGIANGTAANGTAAEGTAANGTVANGTVANGSAANGTAANATAAGGSASNGTVADAAPADAEPTDLQPADLHLTDRMPTDRGRTERGLTDRGAPTAPPTPARTRSRMPPRPA